MELDELKSAWKSPGNQMQLTPSLTPEALRKIKERRYESKISHITISETVGIFVCLAAAVFIGVNFSKLDTAVFQAVGIGTMLLLILIPVISYRSTGFLTGANKIDQTYAATLAAFACQKIRFIRLQKLNAGLCYLLLVAVFLLMSKLSGGKDLSQSRYFWIFSMTIGYIFLMFYDRWVKKYYRRTLAIAENILQELSAK